MKLKRIAIFLLFIITLNFLTPNIKVFAAINEDYGDSSEAISVSEIGSNSTVLNWIAEIVYTLANGIEGLGTWLVKVFTGKSNFPWIDKIIFNSIPILDVNFINPASGSFFEDSNGNTNMLGDLVRNTYFTILSISVGFLTLLVSVMAIRLAVSSIGTEKAKYKEAIINLVKCLVLVFGMHFILAFLFFLNEKMVEVASSFMTKVLNENVTEVIENMQAVEDEDNQQMVKNFLLKNNDQCFIKDIPIVGDIYQGVMDFIHGLNRALEAIGKAIISFFTGKTDKDEKIGKDELGTMYPSLDDYNEYMLKIDREGNPRDTKGYSDKDIEVRSNVAAYILKSKFYRKTFLKWTSGSDANTFREGGLAGVGRNILMTINDVTGIADTGYKSVKTLFTSVATVVHGYGNTVQIKSTQEEAYKKAEADGADMSKASGYTALDVNESTYYSNFITSKETFDKYIDEANARYALASGMSPGDAKEVALVSAQLDILYANAYFKYVYNANGDKDDYPKTQPNQLISGLGDYFKSISWYVDLDSGDWAPDYINPTAAMVYGILILQSLLMFLAYIKRFFYVIILSLIGPIVVIYDFAANLF